MKHDTDPTLSGFELRLMQELADVDSTTGAGRRATPVAGAAERRRVRRLVVSAVATVVALTGAATAVAVLSGGASFQIGAEEVLPGQVVIAKGSGCGSGEAVSMSLDGAAVGTSTTAIDGTFFAEVRIPDGTKPGSHALTARCATADGEDLVQRDSINVVESFPPMGPSLSAAGTALPGGAAIVKGSGCKAAEVSFALDGASAGTAIAAQDGTFVAELSVPAIAEPGDHDLSASCAAPDGEPLVQHATLTVVPATADEPPATKG